MNAIHPQARQLNDVLKQENPHVYRMLSTLGQSLYFPKEGVISQSAEAKARAHRHNATIGIALENGRPMHLAAIQDTLSFYEPKDLYDYAPPAGKPELRAAWRTKMLADNPGLAGKPFGLPIVTNAITHGLSMVADLFAGDGDRVLVPDQNWENYELTFGIRRGAEMVTYPLFTADGGLNAAALREALLAQQPKGKAIVVLNYPNNPTGYTPNETEAAAIVDAIRDAADAGIHVVAVADDAYFGLFFEDSLQESIFSRLADLHPRVLAVKVDGATKEEYAWGFRVGFLTYAGQSDALLNALEQKTIGLIRATISSGPHPSQTFVLHALNAPAFAEQRREKFDIMRRRARKVKELLDSGKFADAWDYYPFNSGYFMCLNLKTVEAEALRRHLLEQYGVGTIALGRTDMRIAFSCIEEGDLADLFETIYRGVKDIEGRRQR